LNGLKSIGQHEEKASDTKPARQPGNEKTRSTVLNDKSPGLEDRILNNNLSMMAGLNKGMMTRHAGRPARRCRCGGMMEQRADENIDAMMLACAGSIRMPPEYQKTLKKK